MANILPQTEKKKILSEYRLRLGVVSVFVAAALIVANILLLTPSYLLVLTKHNLALEHLANLEKRQDGAELEKEVNKRIKELNQKIARLNGIGKEGFVPPFDTFLNIIEIKNPAIKINGFLYDKNKTRERIVVSGRATTRDGLALFLENLKKDPTYAKVELPINSYVKSDNIDFSITIERAIKDSEKKNI